MCTAVGKYLKGLGWVIAKNRDQDYVSDTSFIDKRDPTVGEILLLDDLDIDYREGMNHKGLVIVTTSLTPKLSLETNKRDGDIIEKALHLSDPEEAAQFVISKKLTGFIFIATPEKFVLVEAAREDDGAGNIKQPAELFLKQKLLLEQIMVLNSRGLDSNMALTNSKESGESLARPENQSQKRLSRMPTAHRKC